MELCRYYLQGSCLRGSACFYLHEAESLPGQTDAFQVQTGIDQVTHRGEISSNALVPSFPAVERERLSTQVSRDPRASIPCKFFQRGNCRKGAQCPYAHPQANDQESKLEERPKNEDELDREFSGVVVKFEEGARVSSISVPGDLSSVRISGLKVKTTMKSVMTLLDNSGVFVPSESVHITRLLSAKMAIADIKLEDPSSAETICAKLKDQTAVSRWSGVEVFPNFVPSTMNSISRRINCRNIVISWSEPTSTAWLNFEDQDVASIVTENFNAGRYLIVGQIVRAGPMYRRRPYHSSKPTSFVWTVILDGVPYYAEKYEVEHAITQRQYRPCEIKLAKDKDSGSPADVTAKIKSFVVGAGSALFSLDKHAGINRAVAFVRFEKESDAREAAEKLNEKSRGVFENRELEAGLISSAKFKILRAIFESLGEQVTKYIEIWNKRNLTFKVFCSKDPQQCFAFIKIEGEQAKHVAQAADELEDILSGKTLMNGDVPIWSEAFSSNTPTYQKLKAIQQEQGVFVNRDKLKKCLKFFGPISKYPRFRQSLVELVEIESSITHVIRLAPDEFLWAFNGGLELISNELGGHVSCFDTVSEPKRIVIIGSFQQYYTARLLIKGKKAWNGPKKYSESNLDCTICWTEAEDPIFTKCHHCYCRECFRDLCVSAASEQKDPPITCEGEMGQCKKTLNLSELRKHLSSTAFDEVLEVSFASYIRRHPECFHYCPTPNCGSIYRVTTDTTIHTCPKCLETICAACHEQHGVVMTCAEYKYLKSEAYQAFQNYKREMGIKDCPKCDTPIEKIAGCDHLTCRACGAHICWVCLTMFAGKDPCYTHMISAHGSIGLDPVGGGMAHVDLDGIE